MSLTHREPKRARANITAQFRAAVSASSRSAGNAATIASLLQLTDDHSMAIAGGLAVKTFSGKSSMARPSPNLLEHTLLNGYVQPKRTAARPGSMPPSSAAADRDVATTSEAP
jgi:hypothetical protein